MSKAQLNMTTESRPVPAVKTNKAKQPPKALVAAVPDKPETPKNRLLQVALPPGKTLDRASTDMAAQGLLSNASLVVRYAASEQGELSLTDMVASLKDTGDAVNRGDLQGVEQMLSAQAISLNAIFGELARRSALNMGTYLDPAERYMRLALKAQGQCRATLETLAAIKNPPVVFARQANISNGPQQVNNGAPSTERSSTRAHAPAQACGESGNQSNELLEDMRNGSTALDFGAARAATRSNQVLAPVGKVHRPEVGAGQSRSVSE